MPLHEAQQRPLPRCPAPPRLRRRTRGSGRGGRQSTWAATHTLRTTLLLPLLLSPSPRRLRTSPLSPVLRRHLWPWLPAQNACAKTTHWKAPRRQMMLVTQPLWLI